MPPIFEQKETCEKPSLAVHLGSEWDEKERAERHKKGPYPLPNTKNTLPIHSDPGVSGATIRLRILQANVYNGGQSKL